MAEYAFYDTSLANCIENAFQALALDEKRQAFQPTVWEKLRGNETVGTLLREETIHADSFSADTEASLVSRCPLQHWRRAGRPAAGQYHPGLDDGSS